jgi:predicted RNase H-like nuclease (RuvC/YqgF family)
MSCQYCHKEVKHRKPCKVLIEMQKKERANAEKKMVEAEKNRVDILNTTTDVELLRNEIIRLRLENENLKQEKTELYREINALENPYEEPYQYKCFRCGNETGYDGNCSTCEHIRSDDY